MSHSKVLRCIYQFLKQGSLWLYKKGLWAHWKIVQSLEQHVGPSSRKGYPLSAIPFGRRIWYIGSYVAIGNTMSILGGMRALRWAHFDLEFIVCLANTQNFTASHCSFQVNVLSNSLSSCLFVHCFDCLGTCASCLHLHACFCVVY